MFEAMKRILTMAMILSLIVLPLRRLRQLRKRNEELVLVSRFPRSRWLSRSLFQLHRLPIRISLSRHRNPGRRR